MFLEGVAWKNINIFRFDLSWTKERRFASNQALFLVRRFSWARGGGRKRGTGRGGKHKKRKLHYNLHAFIILLVLWSSLNVGWSLKWLQMMILKHLWKSKITRIEMFEPKNWVFAIHFTDSTGFSLTIYWLSTDFYWLLAIGYLTDFYWLSIGFLIDFYWLSTGYLADFYWL